MSMKHELCDYKLLSHLTLYWHHHKRIAYCLQVFPSIGKTQDLS